MRVRYHLAVLTALYGACGFSPSSATDDAFQPIDSRSIDAAEYPASCAALKSQSPTSPSGLYTIDPDGPGGDPALAVTCDMEVEEGGWTIVFFAASENVVATAQYTASTPRLLNDAQSALIAYRNAGQVVVFDYAVIDLPGFWRVASPFTFAENDLRLPVKINGGSPVTGTLRYGSEGFHDACSDPWNSAKTFGRFCIDGTTAPFFNGFADPALDNCSQSLGFWDASTCSPDKRFSIAVR